MCVGGGGGGGNTPAKAVPRDPFEDESAVGITKSQDEPREVPKDTRGSHENKEKLKSKLPKETPGGNDGPSPFNPRSISDASRYMGGKDIGF